MLRKFKSQRQLVDAFDQSPTIAFRSFILGERTEEPEQIVSMTVTLFEFPQKFMLPKFTFLWKGSSHLWTLSTDLLRIVSARTTLTTFIYLMQDAYVDSCRFLLHWRLASKECKSYYCIDRKSSVT
jgi:hypothetical protein